MRLIPALAVSAFVLAASSAVSGAALAQQAVPPGEKPVDPYIQSNANAGATPLKDDSVFKAFHGKEGLVRITSDLVDRNLADPRISEVFKGIDIPKLKTHLAEQLCYVLDGGCAYTGRDMKTSHKDLGVNMAEMNALVENLQWAMDKEGVPFRAQNKLLAKLAPMSKQAIERR